MVAMAMVFIDQILFDDEDNSDFDLEQQLLSLFLSESFTHELVSVIAATALDALPNTIILENELSKLARMMMISSLDDDDALDGIGSVRVQQFGMIICLPLLYLMIVNLIVCFELLVQLWKNFVLFWETSILFSQRKSVLLLGKQPYVQTPKFYVH
jgi:hypothetical protein